MKNLITARNIFILLAGIYLASVIERTLLVQYGQSDVKTQYIEEKRQMTQKIDSLNLKIQDYENKVIINNYRVVAYTSAQRDSARNLLNPR